MILFELSQEGWMYPYKRKKTKQITDHYMLIKLCTLQNLMKMTFLLLLPKFQKF